MHEMMLLAAEISSPLRPHQAPLIVRVTTFVAIVVPLLGVLAALFFLWGWGFRRADLALLLGMYFFTAIGITVGFHRLFVHRSFETYTWVKFVLVVLGSMAVQGPMLKWVAMHRRHHQYSDTEDDPHSPNHEGRGFRRFTMGFLACPYRLVFRGRPSRPSSLH